LPARKTKGGTRYYAATDLLALGDVDAQTIYYARVPRPRVWHERPDEGTPETAGDGHSQTDAAACLENNALKRNLKALKRKQRRLARKQKGSNRRAKAKFAVAQLHKRISDQRQAVLHELSEQLTRDYKVICLENLNVKGMVRNRTLARPISDAGFSTLRRMIEYKAKPRGDEVSFLGRFEPSSRTCSECGQLQDMPLSVRTMECDCDNVMDRDFNAAKNSLARGPDALWPDLKCTQALRKTSGLPVATALTA
jgi:putative transposase